MATELLASLEKESTVAESDTSFRATTEVCDEGVDEMDLVVRAMLGKMLSSGRMSLGSCVGRGVGPAKGATVKNGSRLPPKSPPRSSMAWGSAQATPTSGRAAKVLIAASGARRGRSALSVLAGHVVHPAYPLLVHRSVVLDSAMSSRDSVWFCHEVCSSSSALLSLTICHLVSTRNAAHDGERHLFLSTHAIAPEPGFFDRCPMHIAPGAIAPLSRRLAFPLASRFSYPQPVSRTD